jgi:transposase
VERTPTEEHALEKTAKESRLRIQGPRGLGLHAKIGQLTLENDFVEGALTKAGLLSAKR